MTTVEPRSYSRNSGRILCEMEMGSPSGSSACVTNCSLAGFAKEKSNDNAMDSAPLSRILSRSRERCSEVGERRISPSALVRSSTPKRNDGGTMQGKGEWNQSYRLG